MICGQIFLLYNFPEFPEFVRDFYYKGWRLKLINQLFIPVQKKFGKFNKQKYKYRIKVNM